MSFLYVCDIFLPPIVISQTRRGEAPELSVMIWLAFLFILAHRPRFEIELLWIDLLFVEE